MSLKSPFLKGLREESVCVVTALEQKKNYLYWIKAFINFQHKRHPETMGAENVRALSNLSGITKIGSTEAKKVGKNLLVCQSGIAFIVLTVCYAQSGIEANSLFGLSLVLTIKGRSP